MKKVGFIDLFIDEWHANNYPQWFKESKNGKDFEITLAWEEAPRGGRPLEQWCKEMNIAPAKSIEEVVENCDCICVLAPSNQEVHERLAELPLKSGKVVYVDKPFAPDRGAAERMFALASQHGTKLMSSSALRYADELIKAKKETFADETIRFTGVRGGGRSFQEYSIHQVEMIVSLMGCGIRRVMQCGNEAADHMLVEYADGRRATVTRSVFLPFELSVASSQNHAVSLPTLTNFFPTLIDEILMFYTTANSPIDPAQTIEIAATVDAGIRGLSKPGEWINI